MINSRPCLTDVKDKLSVRTCLDGGLENAAPEYEHLSRRNNSLSPAGRWLAFGFIAAVSACIALSLSLAFGAWMVMPFTGLEIGVLYAAFRYMDLHARDYERVTLTGNQLQIETVEGFRVRQWVFDRYWAQVHCTGDGSRVTLRSHGREVAVGLFCGEEARRSLAQELRSRVGSQGTGRINRDLSAGEA